MKKTNFLKFALTLVMAFVLTGVFAQSSDVPGTAAQYDATATTTYMMEGTTVPLWATPDPYFHPAYDPDVANSLNAAGFTWTWTEASTTLTITQLDPTDNYVTISAAAGDAGTYTVNVLEAAPAAWGGCDDGVGEDLTVVVVAQPDATLGGTASYVGCEGSTGAPATINATISGGWQNYRLVWSLEIKTLNADGTDNEFYDTDKTTTPVALAESFTTAAPDEVAASGAYDITSVAGGYTVIDNSSTVYTYTLTSINDQASRFGEFITDGGVDGGFASFNYFAIGETITIRVNPTPQTGPIYHILHTWAE